MISKLCLLGRPRAWNGAGVELDWPKKAFLLLGRLAVAEGETELTRADLAEFLWPDSPPEKARAALRTMLKRMRAGVEGAGKAALRLGPDRIALRRDALECDLLEALRDLEQAEPAALARALARLDHAFLAGVTTSDPTIGAWIEAQRARIRNMTAEKARRALNARIYGADARLRENLARRVTDAEPIDSDALNALNKIERSQRRSSRSTPAHAFGAAQLGRRPAPGAPSPVERRLVVKLAGPAPEAGAASPPFVESLLEEFERISGKPVFANVPAGEGAAEYSPLTVDAQSLGVVMTLLKLTRPAGEIIWAGLISAEKAADPLERAHLIGNIVEALGREDDMDASPSTECAQACLRPTAENATPSQGSRNLPGRAA